MPDPESYEKIKDAHDPLEIDVFATFSQKMEWPSTPNQLFLDFGCGAGGNLCKYILPLAKQYNCKVHGVDISPTMIEYAKEHYPNEGVEYFVGDIFNLAHFPEKEKYDKVFSYHVLHWIKDYGTVMQRLFSILKPGGYFGATVITSSSQFWIWEALGEDKKWGGYVKDYKNHIPSWVLKKRDPRTEIENKLKKCGFEIVDLKKITVSDANVGNDIGKRMDLLLSLIPFEIPTRLHSELREDGITILRRMQEKGWNIFQHDGLCFVVQKPI